MAKEVQSIKHGEEGQPDWHVGQKVVHSNSWGESILTVEKITDAKGGTITCNHTEFDSRGWVRNRGKDRFSSFSTTRIHPATEEDFKRIRCKNMRVRLEKRVKWDDVPDDLVEKIWSELKPYIAATQA